MSSFVIANVLVEFSLRETRDLNTPNSVLVIVTFYCAIHYHLNDTYKSTIGSWEFVQHASNHDSTMSNMTIWESASRPLFVRSVWLEKTRTGRGHHRHFILDYAQPRREQPRSRQCTADISAQRSTGALKQPIKNNNQTQLNDDTRSECSDELLLCSSTKLNIQQQPSSAQQAKFNKKYKNTEFLPSRFKIGRSYQRRRLHFVYERTSRRSSLQDLQSTLSNNYFNPEERLAEQVLNWLDLAGKVELLKSCEETNNVEYMPRKPLKSRVTQAAPGHARRESIKQQTPPSTSGQKSSGQTKRHDAGPSTSSSCRQKQNDSVKHVTLLFDKRESATNLKSSKRNIDLYPLYPMAGDVRRLKMSDTASFSLRDSVQKPPSNVEGGRKSCTQKRTRDAATSDARLNDSKKQLHIFMPSLPKKDALGCTLTDDASCVDDAASLLSHRLSEFCNI